jgi:hypothetical protein
MKSSSSETPLPALVNSGMMNARNPGNTHLSPVNEDAVRINFPRENSLSLTTSFTGKGELSPTSSIHSIDRPQQQRQSTGVAPYERQLSLLDPLSDRVSTILVWQNLTVSSRGDKRKEFFQRIKSYKNYVPQRKCLLNNVSGAIAGGLWAVMGNFLWFLC